MSKRKYGDCFQAAAQLQQANPTWTLCHGIVVGQEQIAGLRHWHAWCEREQVITLPPPEERPPGFEHLRDPHLVMVVDHSNGKELEMPAALYYHVGQIDPALVWKYDRTDACQELLRHEHWGPWVPDPEGVA